MQKKHLKLLVAHVFHGYKAPTMDDESELVMAVPRQGLYGLSGLVTEIDPLVIGSIADDHWFGTYDSIDGNIDAKEVCLVVVLRRTDQVLVDEDGVWAHTSTVPASIARLGDGLKAVRDLAKFGSEKVVGSQGTVVLKGYANNDSDEDLRPYCFLVYVVDFSADTAAPQDMSWVGFGHLRSLEPRPLESMLLKGWGDG